jgi:hypothetical protein
MQKPLWTLDLLIALGCELHIDFDDELYFTVPINIHRNKLVQQIQNHASYLAGQVKLRANRDKRRFMGGPLNGQKCCVGGFARFAVLKVGKAQWAVYEPMEDGRAIFKGMASSQAKGRRGQFVKVCPE